MDSVDIEAAVEAALCSNWEKAKSLNEKLLKECPDDVDCLNRLGRALLEMGNNKKAATIFRKVLKVSRFDPIATKNLARAMQTSGKKKRIVGDKQNTPMPTSFVEEPGKTKLIALVNVAPSKTLLAMDYAYPVVLSSRRHSVIVCDTENNYLGALPDDLGHRLLVLMRGGNVYEGFVKSVSKNSIIVFVREVTRAKKFKDTPSFQSSGADYLSYLRDDSLHEEKVVAEVDADEDEVTAKIRNVHSDEEVDE